MTTPMTRAHHAFVASSIWLVACGGAATVPSSSAGPNADVAPPGAPSAGPAIEPRAPTSTRSAVDRLLEYSAIESIVSDRAGPFTRQVAYMAGDLTDPELERLVPAVRAAFAPDLMRRDVAELLAREAPGDGTVEEVLRWQEAGANAELRRVADTYEPPLTLSEYTRSLVEAPPDEERLRLIARWAQAQGAGEFYILMEEALAEAAHAVWAELRPDAPTFTPQSGAALQRRLADSFNASVVSFLYRYETVPDGVIRAALSEYRTEEGQWYVQTYSLAVAEAIRAAGGRAVGNLRTRGSTRAPRRATH